MQDRREYPSSPKKSDIRPRPTLPLRAALLVAFGILSLAPAPVRAESIDGLYVFGDSLSDDGNVAAAVNQASGGALAFPMPPYYNGRFSNGPVWIETVAQRLGVPLHDFAYAGAESGTNNNFSGQLPGLVLPGTAQQVAAYIASGPADPNGIYVLWAGANDYFDGSTNPAGVVANVVSQIQALAADGADRFLIPNLPDLGREPGTRTDPAVSAALSALSSAHNGLLSAALASLEAQLGGGTIIQEMDVEGLLAQALADPTAFSLTNVLDACYTGANTGFAGGTVCATPDSYLFWDDVHPTATGHLLVAEDALSILQPAAVPEPECSGLLFVGLTATLLARGRRARL